MKNLLYFSIKMGDSEQARFEEDLKKALALSLETAAYEKLKRGESQFIKISVELDAQECHEFASLAVR